MYISGEVSERTLTERNIVQELYAEGHSVETTEDDTLIDTPPTSSGAGCLLLLMTIYMSCVKHIIYVISLLQPWIPTAQPRIMQRTAHRTAHRTHQQNVLSHLLRRCSKVWISKQIITIWQMLSSAKYFNYLQVWRRVRMLQVKLSILFAVWKKTLTFFGVWLLFISCGCCWALCFYRDIWFQEHLNFFTAQTSCSEKEKSQIEMALRSVRNDQQMFCNWSNIPIQGENNKIPLLPTVANSNTCRFCKESFDSKDDLVEHMQNVELVTIALIVCTYFSMDEHTFFNNFLHFSLPLITYIFLIRELSERLRSTLKKHNHRKVFVVAVRRHATKVMISVLILFLAA